MEHTQLYVRMIWCNSVSLPVRDHKSFPRLLAMELQEICIPEELQYLVEREKASEVNVYA